MQMRIAMRYAGVMGGRTWLVVAATLFGLFATSCSQGDVVTIETTTPIGGEVRMCIQGTLTAIQGVEGATAGGDTVVLRVTAPTVRLEGDIQGLDFLEASPNYKRLDLAKVDLTQCPKLERFACYQSTLSEIDLSNNPALTSLTICSTPLGSVDVSKCPELKKLVLEKCDLKGIDLTQNAKLQRLSVAWNDMPLLDVSPCPELEILDCNNAILTSLDLSHCPKLQFVWCFRNDLTTLDLSKNVDLELLDCSQNRIAGLNLANCKRLSELCITKNIINSGNMEALVESLPAMQDGRAGKFIPVHPKVVDEMNEISEESTQAALAKGWKVGLPESRSTGHPYFLD